MPANGKSNPFGALRRLLPRLKEGDLSAYDELARELVAELPGVVRPRFHRRFQRLRPVLQTDDIVQNVMLRVVQSLFKKLPETEEQLEARPWLAISRTLTDLVRKHYGPAGDDFHVKFGVSGQDGGETTDHRARRDDRLDIHELVATLPKEDAELIMARYFLGLKNQEIALMHGLDRGTVRRRLNRITGYLADRLEE